MVPYSTLILRNIIKSLRLPEDTTIEREFLADMLMPDGSTVYEWTERPLSLAYAEGQMPAQLLLPGRSTP